MRKKKGFEDKLEIESCDTPEVSLEEVHVVSKGTNLDIKDDYEKIREATITTITRTAEIIDEAAIAIKQSPNGMMVKAYADLVKSMKDNTMALLEMHREIRKLKTTEDDKKETKEPEKIKTNLSKIIHLYKATNE